MAGIGFSLRKILKRDSITRVLAAYTVAGIISGGPWLISILGIVILAITIAVIPEYYLEISQFKISITYLVATSFMYSGLAGNSFSRYVADQLYLNKPTYVISNLNGLMLILTAIGGFLSFLFVLFFFPQQSIFFRFFFMGSFVVLSNIWVVISLLTGLRDYRVILFAFFLSYSLIIGLAYGLRRYGLDAYMFSFLVGQILLLLILIIAIYKEYPTNSIIDFDFLKKDRMFKVLIYSGLLFNMAIWVDKFVFWFNPTTSYTVIGPLRASWIYDLPIFLAYICSLPGMAVFLLLTETNFAEYYDNFHESIRRGKSMSYIKMTGEQMVGYAFNVINSVVKIQAIVIIVIFQFGIDILKILNVSVLSNNLLYIAVVGTSFQVILLAIVNILYYMNRLMDVFLLALVFFMLNLLLTIASIYLGPFYYGFGFTLALVITCTYGMHLLNREFTDLEYKVIMLR